MQIGMATTVPQTPEQKETLTELSITLARAADLAEAYSEMTGSTGVTIQAHSAEDFLDSLSRQIMGTVKKES